MSGIPTAEDEAGWPGPMDPATPREPAHSDRPRRPWLLGALVCAATAAATFLLAFTLTARPAKPVSGSPVAASGPSARATPKRNFTHLPVRCALLNPATVTAYLPGTTCNPNAFQMSGGTDSHAIWNSGNHPVNGEYLTLDIEVLLSPRIQSVTDVEKSQASLYFSAGFTIADARPVAGLGDQAYLVFGSGVGGSRAYLLVVDGNAGITITYTAFDTKQAVSKEQAEAAVLTMAHDVIGGLR